MKSKTTSKRRSKESKKSLRKEAWKEFRTFIFNRDTDDRGYCHCISCPKVAPAEEFQAGHFDHSKEKENYYNPKNVHAQCIQCNYYGGVKTVQQYTINLIRKYGIEEVEKLKNSKGKYWGVKGLKEIISFYKDKNAC